MKSLKWYLCLAALMTFGSPASAQDDDMYFVPKKEAKQPAAERKIAPRPVGPYRNVDEYNRRGKFASSYESLPGDTLGLDVIAFNGVKGVYPDSVSVDSIGSDFYMADGMSPDNYQYDDDDYALTRRMSRWDDFYAPWVYSRFGWGPSWRYGYAWGGWGWPRYAGWYDPWYDGWGWPYYSYYGYGWPYYGCWPYYGYGWPYYGGGYAVASRPVRRTTFSSPYARGNSNEGRRTTSWNRPNRNSSYSNQSNRTWGSQRSNTGFTPRQSAGSQPSFGGSHGGFGGGGSFGGGGGRVGGGGGGRFGGHR